MFYDITFNVASCDLALFIVRGKLSSVQVNFIIFFL